MLGGSTEARKAVVLARGLGTRMRRADPDAALDERQAAVAASGMKGMMPVGRPFLDYAISAIADAGYHEVCLVIGPEHGAVREYYGGEVKPQRVSIHFAEQAEPLGTADAVLAAQGFAAGEPFLVVNSDNYYPPNVLRMLREAGGMCLPGFNPVALATEGNVPAERIAQFALVEMSASGTLQRIVEKPNDETLAAWKGEPLVSMNCWMFTHEIFEACRSIEPSSRGELELPHAVQYLVDAGVEIRVLPVSAAVLDLSSRSDIAAVKDRLSKVSVQL